MSLKILLLLLFLFCFLLHQVTTFSTTAAFSTKYFSDELSLPIKNRYLLTFPDNQAEIIQICLSKLY